MSSQNNNALYVGMTSNLDARILAHKAGSFEKAYTKKYNISKLVYFENHPNGDSASWREKRLKRWEREWKLQLIDSFNPGWQDLAEGLLAAEKTPDQVGGDQRKEQ